MRFRIRARLGSVEEFGPDVAARRLRFHAVKDEGIPPSERFKQGRPNATFHVLTDNPDVLGGLRIDGVYDLILIAPDEGDR